MWGNWIKTLGLLALLPFEASALETEGRSLQVTAGPILQAPTEHFSGGSGGGRLVMGLVKGLPFKISIGVQFLPSVKNSLAATGNEQGGMTEQKGSSTAVELSTEFVSLELSRFPRRPVSISLDPFVKFRHIAGSVMGINYGSLGSAVTIRKYFSEAMSLAVRGESEAIIYRGAKTVIDAEFQFGVGLSYEFPFW